MTDQRPPIEQLLDRVLFAPIGALVALRDELPKLAAQGRREVALAKMFGQFAVQQGKRELDRRLAPQPTPPSSPTSGEPTPDTGAATTEAVNEPSTASSAPIDPSSLPIADYDSLAASQVVARLGALSSAELDAIEAYEAAGRGRRTILGKITQLRGAA